MLFATLRDVNGENSYKRNLHALHTKYVHTGSEQPMREGYKLSYVSYIT